ncbi:nuclear transport factor 2 family protein [Nocardia carnea]|uniref:Nuclear transport factor 2 family protein n=1 Tax=Nocardia carnea TaxID=37328 RepID=A0ABW7TWJ1_9NOCA|nr:nuclear transport factor 2 family protein [Nocardia carnea]
MNDVAAEVQTILAHARIRDCLVRLARGEDRRDATLVKDAFWSDATVDFGIFGGTFDQYLSWVIPGSPAIVSTQHLLGQTSIDLRGEHARTETQVIAYHRLDTGAEHRDSVLGGRYLDRFESRDGRWRIAQRIMLYDWVRDEGGSADWSQGVLGAPLREERFIGRAHGDHSEEFFGG